MANEEPRCSQLSLADDEPLQGTAPEQAGWLLVEQGLPWGRDALLESGVEATVAAELSRRAKAAGVKIVLIRRNDGRRAGTGRRVFAAWLGPEPFVQSLALAGDGELLGIDLEALARGVRVRGGVEHRERLTLVCTNGRRDACCALHGSRAADALSAMRPEETWQCSHLGGHRFAATMLCLPSGACFGRLDPAAALGAVEKLDAGRVALPHLRGFGGRPAAVQAAEALLRDRLGLDRVNDVAHLGVDDVDGVAEVRLRTADGREHVVSVELHDAGLRRVSCAGEPERAARWVPARTLIV